VGVEEESDPFAERLERAAPVGDAIEGERLLAAVKARLFDEPSPETRIDRFVVLGQLGAGGMGVVYAAYDPELDRKVAIKLVRTWGATRREQDQERLVGEARALAKLSHPHVVAVYEVGLHGDAVFIAMEFVRGETLRERVVAGRTPWREAVRMYLQAGEGLAAAHEAGIVHRDFKPDNAIVGDDGRVRVVDFGLARRDGGIDASDTVTDRPTETRSLTVTGAMVGTPAYMAPEQHEGMPAGPRTDQYAFCASLHEALVGTPQMASDGATVGPRLPGRLRRALARGLAVAPEDRFGDVRALLDELRALLETSRRLRVTAAVAAIVGVGAGAVIPVLLGAREHCPDPGPELVAVWSSAQRAVVRAAAHELGATAEASAVVVERELDARAEKWIAGRRDACEGLHVRRTESDALFDRRMRCLDRGRDAMADLIGLLGQSDPQTWQYAVDAVVGLAPVEACADVESLGAEAPLPTDADAAAEVERVRARIDQVRTLEHLGRLAEATPLAEDAIAAAKRTGHRPTEAEALHALAEIESAQQRDAAAAPLLEDAVWRAEAGHADELAIRALVDMMSAEARRGRTTQAAALERRILGALERLGRPTRIEPQFARARYLLATTEERYDDAEAHARAGIEASRRWSGDGSLDLARLTNCLGNVQYERAEYDAAFETISSALEIKREWLGEQHPDVILTRGGLAACHERRGRIDDAEAVLRAAIADAEQSLTGPSPVLSLALDNLANLLGQTGRPEEAIVLGERSLAILEASVGPDDARNLQTLNSLGNAYDAVGRVADARAAYERVIAIADRIDPDHSVKAYAWNNLGMMDIAAGDPEHARELIAKALAQHTRTHGESHPATGQLAYSLVIADFSCEAYADAIVHARQAIAVLEHGGATAERSLALARFALARGLVLDRPEVGRAEAAAAAESAAAGFERLGMTAELAEVRNWQAQNVRE
jgi:eukaryotic-like serine/threonine-protein kinase